MQRAAAGTRVALTEALTLEPTQTNIHLQQELERIWRAGGITAVLVTHDVEEAVYLGDRVVVMQPRPGRIRRIVDVPLQRPRDRSSALFQAIKEDVLNEFGETPGARATVTPVAPASAFAGWRYAT